MKRLVQVLLACISAIPDGTAQVSNNSWVYPSAANDLLYQLDGRGQRISDFSNCGYKGGTEALPNVSSLIPQNRWVIVNPGAGDDTALIQTAIDNVAAMTPDADGWRGVVFLNAGEYQLANTLNIQASGIVLKGAGNSATTGTLLRATDTRQYSLIDVRGSGSRSTVSGTTRSLSQKLVPAGTRTFEVSTAPGYNAGDTVIIRRPSTANWIADIDMDLLGPDSNGGAADDVPWAPGSYDLSFDRVVTRVDGNWITVDAPLPQTFESKYGGGQIWRYNWVGRIRQVGIEDLYGISDYTGSTDENHAWTFIDMRSVENAWVRNITARHFGYAAARLSGGGKWITVADSYCLDPISIITGSRRYSFSIEGAELCLFLNNETRGGRHDFVLGARVPGPNAFVHGVADSAHSDTGPHHRWAAGSLFDNITVNGNQLNVQNRGNMGTGHGWAGAYAAVWNSKATGFRVRNPPTARNWLIGSIGSILSSHSPVGADPPGTYESSGTSGNPVHPRSLYFAQLQQRLKWPDSEHRELWLGDVDQHESADNAGEAVHCDASWLSQIQALGGAPADSLFDRLSGNRFTAFTFDLNRDPGDTIVAASLTFSLRATGPSSSDDTIRLDDSTAPISFDAIGWNPISTTGPTVRSMAVDPALLADGRLNLALGEDMAVDFAVLHFQVMKSPPSTHTFTLPPAADANVQGGTNSATNFGTSTTLGTKDITSSNVHRETFIRWDLSGITGRILGAKVRLVCTATSQPGNENAATFVDNDTWGEATINYNNRPIGGKFFAQWIPVTGQPVEFSVTPQVLATLADDHQLSLCIVSTGNFGGLGNVSYASKEHPTSANHPQLILTVENHAPAASPVADQTIDEDQSTPALVFTVSDDFTAPGSLMVSAVSSNPSLIPESNIVFGGNGGNRTVTVTPAPDQHGLVTITISVSDGDLETEIGFTLTVLPVDDPPMAIPGIADTQVNQPVDIDLTTLASDMDTPSGQLWFETGTAVNGTVVLLEDGRTARFTPGPNYNGQASFDFTVRDAKADSRTLLNYNFQDPDLTSDGFCTDVSGNGRHATITTGGNGSASYTADVPPVLASRHVQSLQLTENGSSGAARIERPLTASTELNWGSHDWTVAGWFKRATQTNQDIAFMLGTGNGRGGTNGFALTFGNGSNNAPLYLRNWNASGLDVDLSTTAATGVWHHIAIVRDGGTLTLFVGGVPVASDSSFDFTFSLTPPFIFGGGASNSSSLWDRWFNGSLADPAIFKGALTTNEIAWISAAPVANLGGQSASNTVSVEVSKSPASVILGSLSQIQDDARKSATAVTDPPGLDVEFTYNGLPDEPITAGTYVVTATINDPVYSGNSSGTLVIHGPPHATDGNLTTAHNSPVSIDLRTLTGDFETPVNLLHFDLGLATGGSAVLDADGHTVHFTPSPGHKGSASFSYTVIDDTPDSRVFLGYDFQAANLADASGNNRDGSPVFVGSGGDITFPSDFPPTLAPRHSRSLYLTKNGLAGAARIERAIAPAEMDFLNADWTLSGWFKRASTTAIDSVVQLGQSGGWGPDGLTLVLPSDSTQLELRNYAAGASNILISTDGLTTGGWHHFAIVRHGSTMSLYVNGSHSGSDSDFTLNFNPASPLKLGGVNSAASSSTWDRWFHGGLADFAVIASPLTEPEIIRLATAPAAHLGGLTASATIHIDVGAPPKDTIVDWRQYHFQTNENTGTAADGEDPDGDGLTNGQEYIFGTIPTSADSMQLTDIGNGSLTFVAKQASGPGYNGLTRFYAIETHTDLATDGSWPDVPGFSRIEAADQTVSHPISFEEIRRFFRLRVWLE